MIEKKINFSSIWQKLLKLKLDKYFYSSSISTSCAIPCLKTRKRIWFVQIYKLNPIEVDTHWFDDEQQLVIYLNILDKLDCFWEIKEYQIEF